MNKETVKLIEYLKNQEDIKYIEINSDIEQDFESFSLSGIRIGSKEYVYPAAMGFDVGCGVAVFKLNGCKEEDIQKLPFNQKTPFGIKRKKYTYENSENKSNMFHCLNNALNTTYLGEIESGNHFIEIHKNEQKDFVLIIHCGVAEKIKFVFASLFIDFYKKYVTYDEYKNNGYIVKIPFHKKDGQEFYELCNFVNEYTKLNREYIAKQVAKMLKLNLEKILDTSHEFLIKENDILIHSNGVQMLDKTNKGIILTGKGHENYLIYGKNDVKFLNHGTPLKKVEKDGKRTYSQMNELLANKDFANKIEIWNITTPIIGCKKEKKKYEYSIF